MDAATPIDNTARFRSALHCATLRRARVDGHVLDRWAWLFPRVAIALALGGVMRFIGPPSPAAASVMDDPAPEEPCVTTSFPCPGTPESVVVIVSRTQILVGDDPAPVVLLPARDVLVRGGLDTRYKRGPDDLLIVPLANALAKVREQTKATDAIVVADAGTPYRLLSEVLFTLGYSELGKYHLMVMTGKKKP